MGFLDRACNMPEPAPSVEDEHVIKQMGDYTNYPYPERAFPGVDRAIARALFSDVSNILPNYDPETDPEFNAGWEAGAIAK